RPRTAAAPAGGVREAGHRAVADDAVRRRPGRLSGGEARPAPPPFSPPPCPERAAAGPIGGFRWSASVFEAPENNRLYDVDSQIGLLLRFPPERVKMRTSGIPCPPEAGR